MKDLGTLDGPVMLFGGPYSNLAATRAVLDRADALSIPAERVICTGDIAGYCGEAAETVAAIRDAGIHAVMGNVEESVGTDAEGCGCGFSADGACSLLSVQWYNFARGAVDDDAKAWMRGLPRGLRFALGGASFRVIHGGAQVINKFIFASTAAAEKQADLDHVGTDAIVGGHCGLPFVEVLPDGRLWLNAGVIGMPANDGTSRGWYALLTPAAAGVEVAQQAIDYDHESTARRMEERGLPAAYAETLRTGLWPNMDELPEAERTWQGQAIQPQTLHWAPPEPAKHPQIA